MADGDGKDIYFPAFYNEWQAVRAATSLEELGRLFALCLDYAVDGTLPQKFETEKEQAFFTFLRGGIDRAKAHNSKTNQKRRYARYRGLCSQNGRDPLEFDLWRSAIDERQQMLTNVDKTDNRIESESNHNQNHNQNHNLEQDFSKMSIRPVENQSDEQIFEKKREKAFQLLENYSGGKRI